jgi:Ca-activated chloride channel family protein
MNAIQFALPQFLLLGLVIMVAAGAFLWWAGRSRQQAISRLGNPALIQRLAANVNWRGRRWQTFWRLAALALLFVALARPQWGSEVREIEQEGLQVMVALDVSQSMLAEDIKPTRLDRAKLEIGDLTERLDGDEIGLVLFSGASFVQVPLTTDYLTALNYLDSAGPAVISRPGTVIGEAIHTATAAFDSELNSQKVLIVMTDGEDVETDPLAAAQEAAGAGVLIYTIGFGTPEGQPVPETNEYGEVTGYKVDQNGNAVLSKLDEATLQEIAQTGGGRYYRATAGGSELDSLLAEIDDLQRAELQSRFETTHIERFQIFLALAATALILGELIADRKGERRRTASIRQPSVFASVFSTLGGAQLASASHPDKGGNVEAKG